MREMIGGLGFAAMQVAKGPTGEPVEVVAYDRQNHQLFQPRV